MAIYSEPGKDYSRDKLRLEFQTIRGTGNDEALQRYFERFIARGHDPNDPRDSMWAIMGIKPAYFDFLMHNYQQGTPQNDPMFKGKPATTLTQSNQPEPGPTPGGSMRGHGKAKRNALTFGPEDD